MANPLLRTLCRVSSLHRPLSFCPCSFSSIVRQIIQKPEPISTLLRSSSQLHRNPQNYWQAVPFWQRRNFSHGSVSLVITPEGKTKFETHEIEPPKKEKWKTKKRLKLQRKKEKQKRKEANKRDPRMLGIEGKKKRQRFANAEERIKYKLENVGAKILEKSNFINTIDLDVLLYEYHCLFFHDIWLSSGFAIWLLVIRFKDCLSWSVILFWKDSIYCADFIFLFDCFLMFQHSGVLTGNRFRIWVVIKKRYL